MPQTIKRICVVRFGGMGDILMTTPALRALSEHFQTKAIDFIVARGNKEALTGIPYIREVIEFGPRGEDMKTKNFLAFLSRLRCAKYDLFLNFQPSLKTVAMTLTSGATHYRIFRKDRRSQKEMGHVRHAIDDFLKEIVPLGVPDVTNRRMDFAIPDAAFATVNKLLQAAGIEPNDRVLVANPGGTREINRWPPVYYARLFDRLAVELPELHLILSGGPFDGDKAEEILRNIAPTTRVLNLAAKFSMKETGALLTRASVLVTPDTGPMHMASALGTPMVVLSGAADPYRTGPTTPGDLVVINRALPCVPCGDRTCRRGDIACMNQMSVDWVFQAVYQRLYGRAGNVSIEPTGIEIVQPSRTGRSCGLIRLENFRKVAEVPAHKPVSE